MPYRNTKHLQTTKDYDPAPLVQRFQALLQAHNENNREASIRADLDQQALRRYIRGQRPDRAACIALADHFGVNPNEFLQLAGYAPMALFNAPTASAEHLPPEVVEVALDLARIPEPGLRREVAQAIRVLLKQYFPPKPTHAKAAKVKSAPA